MDGKLSILLWRPSWIICVSSYWSCFNNHYYTIQITSFICISFDMSWNDIMIFFKFGKCGETREAFAVKQNWCNSLRIRCNHNHPDWVSIGYHNDEGEDVDQHVFLHATHRPPLSYLSTWQELLSNINLISLFSPMWPQKSRMIANFPTLTILSAEALSALNLWMSILDENLVILLMLREHMRASTIRNCYGYSQVPFW